MSRPEYYGKKQPVIPTISAGIIMPFNDVAANIPAGWDEFTGANDKAIKGSPGTAGSTGGSTGASLVSATAGGHNGAGSAFRGSYQTTSTSPQSSSYYRVFTSDRGAHSHTVTATFTPAKKDFVLMKSQGLSNELPPKTALISMVTKAGLDNIETIGSLLGAKATPGDAAEINSLSTNDPGSHDHKSTDRWGGANYGTCYNYSNKSPGAHSGSVVADISKLKKMYAAVYESATEATFGFGGLLAMWESATPPPGWKICDGTDGTPDLSDRFIVFDESKAGQLEGDGELKLGATLGTVGNHNHQGSSVGSWGAVASQHTDNDGSHTHVVTEDAANYEPEYYTLVFITPIG